MKISDLKKLPLSYLAYIINNPTSTSEFKKFAEIEIQHRMKNLGFEYEDFLHEENESLIHRGYDFRNYLINPNPSMQQLMELYFKEVYATQIDESHILFSERHLCNHYDYPGGFFNTVCDIEIERLGQQIEDDPITAEEQSLPIFKEALEERKANMEEYKKYCEGSEKFIFNDAASYLDSHLVLEFGTNITDEQFYKITSSKLQTLKYAILEELNDGIFDADFFQDSYALFKTLEDRAKVSSQKRILLREAKTGDFIDYGTSGMQSSLKRVRTHLNERKEGSK